jgi:hypothetical protein
VSSVNKTGLYLSDIILERSLILKRKKRGQRTEPCGTPCFTCYHSEKYLFEFSYLLTLFDNYFVNKI